MATLELNDKELETVKKALDAYIRVQLGRPDQVMDDIAYLGVRTDGRHLDVGETLRVKELLHTAAGILTGHRDGGPGIFSPIVSNTARLAYRVLERIRGDSLRVSMVDEEGNPT